MADFVAYVNETDNGCDYTIACGKKLLKLKAATKEEAEAELREFADGYDLVSITLYEVAGRWKMPLREWEAEAEKEARRVAAAEKLNREKAEYERLKELFG